MGNVLRCCIVLRHNVLSLILIEQIEFSPIVQFGHVVELLLSVKVASALSVL
jgi:hypothetical protein